MTRLMTTIFHWIHFHFANRKATTKHLLFSSSNYLKKSLAIYLIKLFTVLLFRTNNFTRIFIQIMLCCIIVEGNLEKKWLLYRIGTRTHVWRSWGLMFLLHSLWSELFFWDNENFVNFMLFQFELSNLSSEIIKLLKRIHALIQTYTCICFFTASSSNNRKITKLVI